MTTRRTALSLAVFCFATAVGMAAFASSLRIADESEVIQEWRPAGGKPLVRAGYPADAANKARDICINIGYQINKDGTTSNFSVLRAWSSENPQVQSSPDVLKPFVQSAAAAVSLWQFEPTAGASANREMYSSYAMAFVGARGTALEEVRGHCRIDDLNAFVSREKIAAYRRGNLAKDKLERYRRDNNQMQ